MASSTTTVTSAPDPSVFGQAVTFTATVQPELAGGPALTGSVEFVVDGVSVTTEPLDMSGQAQYVTSALEVGLHGVEANYSGDAEYDPSTGADTQEVNLADTTTTLAFDPEPSVCGETVTVTAQVSPRSTRLGNPHRAGVLHRQRRRSGADRPPWTRTGRRRSSSATWTSASTRQPPSTPATRTSTRRTPL
ncbi:hypothetical protein GCM10020254_24600 [Streptomyces goshikiensis]